MALSFQEAEGCAAIWEFVHQVQQQLLALAEDGLSDDALDGISTSFNLNPPTLGNLEEIDANIRSASMSQSGRAALAAFLVKEDYIRQLIKLVQEAEDLESLVDLHRLCNIMKALILMNDNSVIEHLVTDDIVLGVVGALEYDPDFPTHKANHRQYLSDPSRFKQVVEIRDALVREKIRRVWRLQYLKDVVLARILDDPTFGVLNSLVFFHQIDIIQFLQSNTAFLKELFGMYTNEKEDMRRKEQGVHFVQQCCALTKTHQMQLRVQLLNNFISHGLFTVIAFAVRHPRPAMRTTGIDILSALMDHDPHMVRSFMLKAVHEKKAPLTDILIDLFHVETDLGVKNQLADSIKILLDPQPPQNEGPGQRPGVDYMNKRPQLTPTQAANEQFAQDYFDRSARKLFTPLRNLEHRKDMNMSYQEVTLFTYIVEVLTFFIRQHSSRSRPFVAGDQLTARVAQLLRAPQKSVQLTAVKFFRTCIMLQDQFYTQQVLAKSEAFDAILDIVIATMPRDNLLNSACLETFMHIHKEMIKPVIAHLAEKHREKMQAITYVEVFADILLKFDQLPSQNGDVILFSNDEDMTPINRRQMTNQWAMQDMDPDQEAYFNSTSDDDEEEEEATDIASKSSDKMQWQRRRMRSSPINGASPVQKPLVSYGFDEDDEDIADQTSSSPRTPLTPDSEKSVELKSKRLQPSPDIKEESTPPERLAEKRRRQEGDDEDELDKLSTGIKRRNSTSSESTLASTSSLRRKKNFLRSKQYSHNSQDSPEARKPRKIAISLNAASKGDEDIEQEEEKDKSK